jgi:hypothetical protein
MAIKKEAPQRELMNEQLSLFYQYHPFGSSEAACLYLIEIEAV